MIISIDDEKAFDKVQHPFRIKTITKLGIKGAFLNIIKAIYKIRTTHIILNEQKLKAFPLRSGVRQGCPLSLLLFNIVLTVQTTATRKKEEIKCIQFGKQEVKLSSFAEDMTVYIGNPIDATKKLFDLISEFSKVSGLAVNIQESIVFLYTSNELSERETKKKITFIIATTTKK